jgi:hypothetical protein
MHFDHNQGHHRKKSPFLSNGIDPNANIESTKEIGNRKINFTIVKNNTGPFLQHYRWKHLPYADAGDDLLLETVQGTRIPW